ncbi:MAG: aminoacyl-tRNA hydrolase [Lachnospiraceae bacterium]|nr:aminoacyl-tRNA hydrolase [Lachnospiraceae bacterium]
MYLIAGLGNPTKEYEHTRHNTGFDAIDRLAAEFHIDINDKKFRGITGRGFIGGERVILLKPQTFMNLSGESVQPAAAFFKIPPENIIVLVDDINLPPGKLRIRKSGSAGGHNGLKSIIRTLASDRFQRVRIGVGDSTEHRDLRDHVLSKPSGDDAKLIGEAVENAVKAVEIMVSGDTDRAMNLYN